ncbi:MAG: PaaI family thioesterase [Bacteroidales bacterium]|nr:PaaI family thioesterase [Bacteroidales bacterium]
MEDFIKKIFIEVVEQKIPMAKFIGVKVLEIDEGFVKLLFPYRDEFIGDPRTKRLHGGYTATAVDLAGGVASMTYMTSPDDDVATIDMRIDYLRPGKAKDLIAEGYVLSKRRRSIVTEMKIYHSDDKEKIIAIGRGVFRIKRKEDNC